MSVGTDTEVAVAPSLNPVELLMDVVDQLGLTVTVETLQSICETRAAEATQANDEPDAVAWRRDARRCDFFARHLFH